MCAGCSVKLSLATIKQDVAMQYKIDKALRCAAYGRPPAVPYVLRAGPQCTPMSMIPVLEAIWASSALPCPVAAAGARARAHRPCRRLLRAQPSQAASVDDDDDVEAA